MIKGKEDHSYIQECIQKFPDWVNNEVNNKLLFQNNTKGYGGKTH